ncbi:MULTISPECIES: hypothetical protein [unclassified Streptomyces]|uniref:hypothetical protein n=1 Tax=unclassified Streptomyces TaxID=2593676 RepID=UPI000A902619|nr:hypothetical protein [Streptomyces sp. CNQ-509]
MLTSRHSKGSFTAQRQQSGDEIKNEDTDASQEENRQTQIELHEKPYLNRT